MKFQENEHVIIKEYIGDEYNERGRVNGYNPDTKKYWVTNMNMPFMGTVSDFFDEDELEKIDGS